MQLVVDKIAKAFGIHEIFKNVSFMIEQGEHVGLVGVNGSGKTTLLRCLLQPDWIDEGAIKFEPGISVGYVQQGFTEIHGTIWEFMSEACPEITELRKKLAELEQAANGLSGEALDECLDEYARVTKRYEFIDGYNFENRIKRVLIGLGYTEEWWSHEANNLSGGQKTRLMLAAALVRNPDFMILDEPTNHLDIIMTQWLEKYLQEFKGGLLVVSHDRAFWIMWPCAFWKWRAASCSPSRVITVAIWSKRLFKLLPWRRPITRSRIISLALRPIFAASKLASRAKWRVVASPSWIEWSAWMRPCITRSSSCACHRQRNVLTEC